MTPQDAKNVGQANQEDARRFLTARARTLGLAGVDDLDYNSEKNSDFVALSVENTHATKTINLVVGTPYGVPSEFGQVPNLNISEHFLDNLDVLKDEDAIVGVPKLILFNERLLRHSVIITRLQIMSTGETSEQQRQQKMKFVHIPMNAQNANLKEGAYVAQFTEFTGVELLSKSRQVGEYSGFIYPVLPETRVDINIYLGDIARQVFGIRK